MSVLRTAVDALHAGRAEPDATYDRIAHAVLTRGARSGAVPFKTLEAVRRAGAAERVEARPDEIEELIALRSRLRHRPIDLPPTLGRVRFHTTADEILVAEVGDRPGGVDPTVWAFSHAAPPSLAWNGAVDADARALMTQTLKVNLPGAHWLPLTALLRHDRFPRMQEIRGELATSTEPGRLYAFVSHRWLTPLDPDPERLQASLLGWQLFAHLAEAVRVAARRGLSTPRRFSPTFQCRIGLQGSALAESLLVNVLRPGVTDAYVRQLVPLLGPLEPLLDGHGVSSALERRSLEALRRFAEDVPAMRALTDRVMIWYDFSCLPQEPRTESEQAEFEEGLRRLHHFQVLGRTVVLLDRAETYLTRAWCVFEGVVSDSLSVEEMDVLVGSERREAERTKAEDAFRALCADRPHLVWRALLDVEVFGRRTRLECMEKLELSTLRPQDREIVYGLLRGLPGPRKVHIDDAEVVTGVFPVVVPPDARRALVLARPLPPQDAAYPPAFASLDATDVYDLTKRAAVPVPEEGWPAYRELPCAAEEIGASAGSSPFHVHVIASSEGEAILFAAWIERRRAELEARLGAPLRSLSWLALDVAPVGHLPVGALEVRALPPTRILLVASSSRLAACPVASKLEEALRRSAPEVVTMAIDRPEANLVRLPRADTGTRADDDVLLAIDHPLLAVHAGGAFRADLVDALRAAAPSVHPTSSRPPSEGN